MHLIAVVVFHSEAHSTNFDRVKFLDFVVIFAFWRFQRPDYQPQSVNRFVFGLVVAMVDEEAASACFS
jgi:hypothetical protein